MAQVGLMRQGTCSSVGSRRSAHPGMMVGSSQVVRSRTSHRLTGLGRSAAAAAGCIPPRQRCKRCVKLQAATVEVGSAALGAVAVKPPSMKKKDSQYALFTLTTWLFREEQRGTLDTELATVLSSVSLACKQIASLVGRAGVSSMTGLAGTGENIQGEEQKKLDVVSNEIFCNCLRATGRTGIMASEEEDQPVAVEQVTSGNYIVVFDPLDGSSNIDAGISVGSIFGIYEPNEQCPIDKLDSESILEMCVTNVCQPGKNLLAAGYCLYSSCTVLMLTIGDGVYGFTLDPLVGEFVLTHDRLKVPDYGKIYAFNEGNYAMWDDKVRSYMDSLKDASRWGGKPYSARYIGSLVGDFHRTLLYGGIYGYPADEKNKTGKLRLLYECAPMTFLAEQAGGKGSDGTKNVMDIMPTAVHQRVPLYIGSKMEVEYLESFFK